LYNVSSVKHWYGQAHASGSSILAAALIVSLVWLSPARALADELPNDTNQIESLTPDQAKKLAAEFPGVWVVFKYDFGTVTERGLPLNGLKSLDADTAKPLAESKAWDGQLPRITAFESPDSVEIAAALATRKGPLSLRNLTKISPKTLTSLIEKEDVEIPLIETLELIQEPDGSPTDDFVIPKGFQSRQKARQQGR
jgi:hypothetical protein